MSARSRPALLPYEDEISSVAVAKIEQRNDVLLSTLISYVKAAGGRYEIEVSFDDI